MSNNSLLLIPNDINQIEFLEKSKVLMIKIKSSEILYKLYEKYSYKSKITKKDTNNFSNLISYTYSVLIFENYLLLLNYSCEKNLPNQILCNIYEFFTLILIRNDQKILPLLEQNVQIIISNFLIYNNKLTSRDQYDYTEVIKIIIN